MIQGYSICSFCGSSETQAQETNLLCLRCKKTTYINYSCATGVFFYNDDWEVLIAQRARDPDKWKYDDPGGFVDLHDGSIEDALVREIHEELWIHLDPTSLHYLDSEGMNYRYQDRDTPVMVIYFYAYLSRDQINSIITNDDVAAVQWVNSHTFDPSLMVTTKKAQCVKKVFDIITVTLP